MATETHLHVRSARDRLIDMLRLGETYPLQDVAVEDEQLTVSFDGEPSGFEIDPGQVDVEYELFENGKQVQRPAGGEGKSGVYSVPGRGSGKDDGGNDEKTILDGPPITDDR